VDLKVGDFVRLSPASCNPAWFSPKEVFRMAVVTAVDTEIGGLVVLRYQDGAVRTWHVSHLALESAVDVLAFLEGSPGTSAAEIK
jgi:hypothetical protein